jgi:hypothetical protein
VAPFVLSLSFALSGSKFERPQTMLQTLANDKYPSLLPKFVTRKKFNNLGLRSKPGPSFQL